MKTTILIFLLAFPFVVKSQTSTGISYQEGLDNCRRIAEENKKSHPDELIYTGPECLIGAIVPEFSTITFDQEKISAEYFKGKITILNFWSISCPPCIAEIPGFNNVVAKYGHDRFNYLAISPYDEKDVRAFLIKHPWNFSQITSDSKLKITYDIFQLSWGYPTTFVINENAVIIAAFSGGKSDERAVQELEDKLSGIIQASLK